MFRNLFFYDDTIFLILGLDNKDINKNSVIQAAKANLHEFIINELPMGYETIIGERY